MADTGKILYTGQPGTSDTLLYTVPALTTTYVRSIHICNTTATPRTVTLGLNSGAALAAANHFISAVTIPANGTYDWSGNQVLEAADTVRALQENATACTFHLSGIEEA
jgi:hypothetical protein